MLNKHKLLITVALLLSIVVAIGLLLPSRYDVLTRQYTEQKKQLKETQLRNKLSSRKESEQTMQLCQTLKNRASSKNFDLTDRERIELDRDCSTWSVDLTAGMYVLPSDLSYCFLKTDKAYTTQSFRQHFSRNGYMAIDLGTGGEKLNVHAPSYMPLKGVDEEREYVVSIVKNYGTMGLTVELNWNEDDVIHTWAIGHMNEVFVKNGDVVRTGDVIGISGGVVDELQFDEKSTGAHAHIEHRISGVATPYPAYAYTVHYGDNGKASDITDNARKCTKLNVDEDQQQYVRMASTISNGDKRFLALLNAENGLWTPVRAHDDGVGHGFCGISYPWHKDIIEDERFLSNPQWQLEQCYRLWKGGTKFFGNIESQLDKFICQ